MLIRRLTEDDLDALWDLRLRALADDPEAFATVEREARTQGNASLRHRLAQENQNFFLGAFENGLVGMIAFTRVGGAKGRHKGTVTSLFVPSERRRQGIARALVQELIAQAKRFDGLEQLHLEVVAANPAAVGLYKSLGFEVYGTARRSLKMDDQYWDEDLMVLHLNASEEV